jgi:hypothetical protein
MLQWTCRLRDTLERGGFCATRNDSLKLSQMREAEFLVAPDGGTFPNDFRWQSYTRTMADADWINLFRTRDHPSLQLGLAVDLSCSIGQSIRSLSGQTIADSGTNAAIHVLWLSKSVFISPLRFNFAGNVSWENFFLDDYGVTLYRRSTSQSSASTLYAASLSAFIPGAVEERSFLALQFLQHMTALAPAGFFDAVSLERNADRVQGCPEDCLVQFLSIFASGTSILPATEKTTISITGSGTINADELRAIMSHQFSPSVQLAFDENPFDSSVSAETIIELLRGNRSLRCIYLPQLPEGESQNALEGVVAVTVKSPNLLMHTNGSMHSQLLYAAATIHQVTEVCFSLDCKFWDGGDERQQRWAETFLHPFLDGRFNSECLRLKFHCFPSRPDLPERVVNIYEGNKQRVRQWATANMIPCTSEKLRIFNVALSRCALFKNPAAGNVDSVELWDTTIFPGLVLNYHRQSSKPLLGERLLPLAVGAINRGQIYRRTTGHAPVDWSTASAGLIFEFIKVTCGVNHDFGLLGSMRTNVVNSRLSGHKRSAQFRPSLLEQGFC